MPEPVKHCGVLDLEYSSRQTAVLLHEDGTGFCFYPSGKKAICVTGYGSRNGMPRRYACSLYGPNGGFLGAIDEWGKGFCGLQGGSSMLIGDENVELRDEKGHMTSVPRAAGASLRVDASILVHVSTKADVSVVQVDFACEDVSHTFSLGEQRDGTQALAVRKLPVLSNAPSTLTIPAISQLESIVKSLLATAKSTALPAFYPTETASPALQKKSSVKGLFCVTTTIDRKSDIDYEVCVTATTSTGSKHPLSRRHISAWSGKYTPFSKVPKTKTAVPIRIISMSDFPDYVSKAASQSKLLLCLCVAVYAKAPCHFALTLASNVYADVEHKATFVAVELSEFPKKDLRPNGFDKVPQAPFLIVYARNKQVAFEPMGASHQLFRCRTLAQPRLLLLETDPKDQLASEKAVKGAKLMWDLAISAQHCLELLAQNPYGILLVSLEIGINALRSITVMAQRLLPDIIILGVASRTIHMTDELKTWCKAETKHIFPRPLRAKTLEDAASRFKQMKLKFKHAGNSRDDFRSKVENWCDEM
eukprot:GEMP01017497.1.p1 GENE.GEMP01017497.1~~GEMP01017497.1.p1  ORF type:complete len:533 (+),score=125.47 GEMP01017497.1:52-1650(+)